VTTNVLNALQALGILPAGFKFVSGHWEWINQTMNPLGAVALALWCAFQVLDEAFLAYDAESVHRVIFIEAILTMIFLQLMPRESTA
jgi:hypothetical protein